MTDDQLANTLCQVLVSDGTKACTLIKPIKEVVEDIKYSKLPRGTIKLYTVEEDPILIALFLDHK